MNVLDIFSGIGGFSLGLERAGMRTVAFCEIDPFCQRVLKKHWPEVPCYDDITTLTADRLAADGIHACGVANAARNVCAEQTAGGTERQRIGQCGQSVDVICGGFPCQDISIAGKGAGIEGERSGLWKEYARIIGEIRPRYVIVENVSALLSRGLGVVLGDLAALRYDAEWHCIPASAVGAPHRRDRIWIVAYPAQQCINGAGNAGAGRWNEHSNGGSEMANSDSGRCGGANGGEVGGSEDVADTDKPRLERWLAESLRECAEQRFAWAGGFQGWDEAKWFAESGMGRVSNGTANRVDRLRSLGNAVVPAIPEIIGRAILAVENGTQ